MHSSNDDWFADYPAPSGDFLPIAYVRPVIMNGGKDTGYAICASDGTQLAIFSTREAAYFAAKQFDLEPMLIH